MRQPELIAYGFDETATAHLSAWATPRGIRVRPVQKRDACLQVLREGFAKAVICRAGRDVPVELELMAAIHAGFPEVAGIVIEESDHSDLRAAFWDVGVRLVISPRAMPSVLEMLDNVFRL